MTIVLIILAVLTFALLWIIAAPIRLYIDSPGKLYYAELAGIFRARVVFSEDELVTLYLRILFFTKKINPLQLDEKKKEKRRKEKKVKEKKEKKRSKKKFGPGALRIVIRAAREILGTFRVKKLDASFDTGDPALNGILVPVLEGFNRGNISIRTNFTETNYIILNIQNRLISIIYVGIKYFIKLKKYF